MKNKIKILAIETSCDETAAAVVELYPEPFDKLRVNSSRRVTESMVIKPLSSVVFSQIDIHKKYGGVFPELASREHIKKIKPVVEEALNSALVESRKYKVESKNSHLLPSTLNLLPSGIDAIAVTVGPGLIGSLIVGVEYARGLATALNKPVIPINHIEGHIYACFTGEISNFKFQISKPELSLRGSPKQSHVSSRPERRDPLYLPDEIARLDSRQSRLAASVITPPRNDIIFPALALVVSGGHTMLVLMRGHLDYKIIGTTLDDAAGECFDKIARMLGLSYPGGPALSKLAEKGNAAAFDFPRSMLNSGDFNFSFSGLKTAVFYKLRDLGLVDEKAEPISPPAGGGVRGGGRGELNVIRDISASAQQAIVDVLVKKTFAAAEKYKVKSILVGGGVSANSALRQAFGCHPDRSSSEAEGSLTHLRASVPVFLSPLDLTGDNALSIAIAACYRYKNGDTCSWHNLDANASLKLSAS